MHVQLILADVYLGLPNTRKSRLLNSKKDWNDSCKLNFEANMDYDM